MGKTVEKSTRLNFLVRQSVKDRLDRVQAKSEAESLTEVVRRSLVIYELLLNRAKGSEIIIRYRDGREKVLLLPEAP